VIQICIDWVSTNHPKTQRGVYRIIRELIEIAGDDRADDRQGTIPGIPLGAVLPVVENRPNAGPCMHDLVPLEFVPRRHCEQPAKYHEMGH